MFAIEFKDFYLGQLDRRFVSVTTDSNFLLKFKTEDKAKKFLKKAQYKWRPLRRLCSGNIVNISNELSPVVTKRT